MTNLNPLKINKEQQNFQTVDIASLWAGINVCLPSFMLGGLLIPSFSLAEAITITLIANLVLVILIYLMGLPGVASGYSSVYLSRYFFGYPIGSKVPSLTVIISMIGWAAILLNLSGQAAFQIINLYTPLLAARYIIIFIGILVIISSLAGPEKMKYISKLNAPALIILLIWVLAAILQKYSLTELLSFEVVRSMPFHDALDIVIGGTIAGAFVSSDLSRYARDNKSLAGGLLIGSIPTTLLLAIIGMLSRIATGSWNPVSIISSLGLGIPALLLVILSTWTTIQVSLYSGGIAINNLVPRLKPEKALLITGLLMIILAAANIINFFENWLILLDYLFAPMIGIGLAKIFLNWQNNWQNIKTQKVDWLSLSSLFLTLLFSYFFKLPFPTSLVSIILAAILYFILQNTFTKPLFK